jgi:hypothetical protein
MRSNTSLLGGVSIALLCAVVSPTQALGANAYPVFTDPNAGGLMFGVTDVFAFGANYAFNDTAQLNGNAVVSISQMGLGAGGTGAGLSVPVSNGENGIHQSLDGAANTDVNMDLPNATAANSVFATIGNASGKLENGNVVRYSAWFRSDPANPITVDPQIQPVLKFEFWKEARSTNQDTNGGQQQPFFGDKVFDQDQHGGALGIDPGSKAQWIDFNGDGVVIDGAAQGENRVSSISTSAWTLVESSYTVDDTTWLGIADDIYDVADIEEVRAVMFLGDFANTDLTGDGNGGNLLMDNVLVEVFKDVASVTPNTNPNPDLPAGLPGDYNENQVVDAADYVMWRDRLGGGGASPTLPNDSTPGIGQDDYDRWRTNFGRTSGPGAANGAAVPEPAAAIMVFALMAASMTRVRRD